MERIHMLQIKAQCIIFAANEGMAILTLGQDIFEARGNGSILSVPYQHIFDSIQQGWTIEEVLQNESCHDEAS
jgi:hypothetical protein